MILKHYVSIEYFKITHRINFFSFFESLSYPSMYRLEKIRSTRVEEPKKKLSFLFTSMQFIVCISQHTLYQQTKEWCEMLEILRNVEGNSRGNALVNAFRNTFRKSYH
jgi:hypothetical protein